VPNLVCVCVGGGWGRGLGSGSATFINNGYWLYVRVPTFRPGRSWFDSLSCPCINISLVFSLLPLTFFLQIQQTQHAVDSGAQPQTSTAVHNLLLVQQLSGAIAAALSHVPQPKQTPKSTANERRKRRLLACRASATNRVPNRLSAESARRPGTRLTTRSSSENGIAVKPQLCLWMNGELRLKKANRSLSAENATNRGTRKLTSTIMVPGSAKKLRINRMTIG